MKKLQILGFALAAVFAFGAVAAFAAFAAPEWLDNGSVISEAVPVLSELMTPLLVEDMANSTEVECSVGENEGTIGPGKVGAVARAECLKAAKVSGLCEEPPEVKIFPVGLPWNTELILVEEGGVNMYRDLVTNASAGYTIECKTIIGVVKDECKGAGISLLAENDGTTGTVLLETDTQTEEESEKNMKCAISGGVGLVLAGSDILIISDEGLVITVGG